MTQYNILNVKLSNSKLNKLKSGIKSRSEVTLNLSWNSVRSSNDEINFPHELSLTHTKVSKIQKAYVNGSSPKIKLLKNSNVWNCTIWRISAWSTYKTVKEITSLANSITNPFKKEIKECRF